MSEFNAVEEIKKLDPNDPDYTNYLECIIKKSNHGAKLDAYTKIFFDCKYAPRKPRAFKKHIKYMMNQFLTIKIETHRQFWKERGIREQMYGIFDWKKN